MPSSNPPKLHLNEHLSPRLATELRTRGFDVTSSRDSSLLSKDDEEQMAFAVAEQRAMVTFNFSDFVSIHTKYMAEGRQHWGIILSTQETTGVLLHRLLGLLNSLHAEDLINQIRWLNEFK
ncbi:MAG TPA: DUF5615 family PIN-like protein [Blastocatellia bacterium]|nr:DUF5615 family PIN-like protein [Blastocatellia bacterium]